jgi:hypothetical protein
MPSIDYQRIITQMLYIQEHQSILIWHEHITWGREVKCCAYKILYIDVQQNNTNQYL